jgi:NADH-quinone oxidoreductase subunit F
VTPTDDDILERYRDEPAPLLPILHAFHDRDGYLSDEAIRFVADGLRTPVADLFGTVTFYHHFSREPGGRSAPRVCDGPICKHSGGDTLLAELRSEGGVPMPCAGRCDEPIPVLKGSETLAGTTASSLTHLPSPLPPAYPGETGEAVFRHIRDEGRAKLEGYGGYAALEKALKELSGQAVIDVIADSGLAGRGGAGFPTARKWQAVRDAEGTPKTIVCNADEGEPGCFKDRALMDYDPHAVIEGMILAGLACGAERGFLYLRYEYPETLELLEDALEQAVGAGYLGANILGSDFSFRLYIRRGAGAYICGEETSLLNSLEGKHPFPRNRPPYPVTHGFEDKPTAVNNVETLASVPHIINEGADWYRGLGLGDHAGTKLISLSGDVQRPGNYEVPIGLPLVTLLNKWAGGPKDGRRFQAVTMAGLSGGFLGAEAIDEVTLDEPCLRARGSFLGAGGIMVFDDSRDIFDTARQAMSFFAHESCGKCFPCRIGTNRLTERLSGTGPKQLPQWQSEVEDIGATMKATSACGLGMAAPLVTESLLRYFPTVVEQRVKGDG